MVYIQHMRWDQKVQRLFLLLTKRAQDSDGSWLLPDDQKAVFTVVEPAVSKTKKGGEERGQEPSQTELSTMNLSLGVRLSRLSSTAPFWGTFNCHCIWKVLYQLSWFDLTRFLILHTKPGLLINRWSPHIFASTNFRIGHQSIHTHGQTECSAPLCRCCISLPHHLWEVIDV